MKIRNSSRIIALALALVMIVPLISIPTFAADAVAGNNTTILLENDFEDYTLTDGAFVLGDDDFFAGDPNTGDGAYHTDPEVILAQVVANPDGEGKVWEVNSTKQNANSNTSVLQVPAVSYNDYAVVEYETKMYLPYNAAGVLQVQWNNNTTGWHTMYSIQYAASESEETATNAAFNNMNASLSVSYTIPRDEWFTISVQLELATGVRNIYVNDQLAFTASGGYTNVITKADTLYVNKIHKSFDAAGVIYVDDVVVSAHKNMSLVMYENDFESEGASADAIYASVPQSDTIVSDPNGSENKVVKMNMKDYHIGNNSVAIEKITKSFNYAVNPNLVFEYDFYVGEGAKGQVAISSYTGSTKVWNSIVALDLDNGVVTVKPKFDGRSTVTDTYDHAGFAQETWYKLAVAMNLVDGTYDVYIDGYKVLSAKMASTNFAPTNIYWMKGAKANQAPGDGVVYYDNVRVYRATEPTNAKEGVRPSDPYYEDFSVNAPESTSAIHTNDPANDGNKVAQIKNHHDDAVTHANISMNYADVVLQADYYLDCEAGDVFNLKSDIQYMDGKDANEASQKPLWTTLFMIWHNKPTDIEHARLSLPNGAQQATYYRADAGSEVFVPVKEWFTVSVVINMKSGMYTIYVDGIAYAEASFASLTDLTWRNDSVWYVLKASNSADKGTINPGEAYVDNLAIYNADGLIKDAVVDESKTLQYVDVTIGEKNVKTPVTKYLVQAGETFSANPVYFNDGGEFNSIVSNVGKVSIRYGNGTEEHPAGMRFATKLDTDLLKQLQDMVTAGTIKSVDIGTLIAPEDYLTEDVKLTDLKAGETVLDIDNVIGKYYEFEGDTNTYFVGSIANIKTGNYDRNFAAAGYVKVVLLSGKTVTLLSDVYAQNIEKAADEVLKQYGDTLNAAQKEILNNYIHGISNGEPVVETPEA